MGDTISEQQYQELSAAVDLINRKIDDAGLCVFESEDTDLDQYSHWYERAIVRSTVFYRMCDNNGRVYPHLDYGLSIYDELKAVGANSTCQALSELSDFGSYSWRACRLR